MPPHDTAAGPVPAATVTRAMGEAETTAIRFESVSRHFGPVIALDRVSFEIRDGEFFSMLGPSGSGKTTSLRLIAGFDFPSAGRITLHGKDVAGVPPFDRDVNTVFQDYALFPHMSVWENVAYGLMVRRMPRRQRREEAARMLAMVKLEGLAERRPGQLSGGQRQRVALARALVNRPSVLLLDEPLGALDLKLREQMQEELKALQRQVGITFIYVTHDQGEALAMSDRVAVFNDGRIEQIGSPRAIYDQPRTAFVAGFVGASNLFEAATAEPLIGEARAFSVRPERIRLLRPGERAGERAVEAEGTVRSVTFLGTHLRAVVALARGGEVRVAIAAEQKVEPGTACRIAFDRSAINVLSDAPLGGPAVGEAGR